MSRQFNRVSNALFPTVEDTAAVPEKGLLCGSRRNPSNLGFQSATDGFAVANLKGCVSF